MTPTPPPPEPAPTTPATTAPAPPPNRVLARMLERLFASIVGGPSLNCRPHHSRQRLDLTQLSKLGDVEPSAALRSLLSSDAFVSIVARHVAPPGAAPPNRFGRTRRPIDRAASDPDEAADAPSSEALTREALAGADLTGAHAAKAEVEDRRRAFGDQTALLAKVRLLVDEARTYEDDTGVYVLNIGYPLLSLPPGALGATGAGSRRVLAPIAFIPVSVTVKSGVAPSIELGCKEDEIDRVQPNEALLAWLEQQTGKSMPATLFEDDAGRAPFKEVCALVGHVCGALGLLTPAEFVFVDAPTGPSGGVSEEVPVKAFGPAAEGVPNVFALAPAPRADEAPDHPAIIAAAVLGLFPIANEGLLRDTQSLASNVPSGGPLEVFVKAGVNFDDPPPVPEVEAKEAAAAQPRNDGPRERLVTRADPCQARAVALARTTRGLVVHGPPGTGKSQTITNIIGDHLARGERVLFVCEKRTALDVVANRLEGLGLSSLCALIHDPQRDQKDLYMGIRAQLETLAEASTHPRAADQVVKLETERAAIHAELTAVHRALMHVDGDGPQGEAEGSVSHMVGEWIETLGQPAGSAANISLDDAGLAAMAVADHEKLTTEITNLVARAADADYPGNPWAGAAGLSLDSFLMHPFDGLRARLSAFADAGAKADAAILPGVVVEAFDATIDLASQAAARAELATEIEAVVQDVPRPIRTHWSGRDSAAIVSGRRVAQAALPLADAVLAAAPDRELLAMIQSEPPNAASIAVRLVALGAWLPASRSWWGWLAFGKRAAAGAALRPLGVDATTASAERGQRLYHWLRAGIGVRAALDELLNRPFANALPLSEDAEALKQHGRVLGVLERAKTLGVFDGVRSAIGSDETTEVVSGLRAAGPRAAALEAVETAAGRVGAFHPTWLAEQTASWRRGGVVSTIARDLVGGVGTLEGVLRTREGLAAMHPAASTAVVALIGVGADPEAASRRIMRCVLAGEVARRITADPVLRGLDAVRMEELFARSRELSLRLQEKVRDATIHLWTQRQKTRLLAVTQSKMNSLGASTRQRLTTRGKNAMRLRQVLALGRATEGGDPLMDLRPVWMASPETVAQIFPREAVFDVVIFDEASQCRLEEALPVLTRAKRVVIAGDPKQLPPTRFFESAVAESEATVIENDEQLFEARQSAVEDLLTAALGLDIEQSYLDVHYRSRNADLIEFSNAHFYGSRLQAIPGHPSQRAILPPLTLYQIDGVYDERANEKEADAVVKIIRDLLRRAEPPSIGVGCFNIAQRDLISERLDELAAEDAGFARALAVARERRSAGAFDGLFVKNLENVQGDERDHIIISTTYGPNAAGTFYRRFGPLAMPGGGRRLNVLITRARIEVHLVTSIPREVYAALPPVPEGSTPGGGWLLFAYLRFAEELAEAYRQQSQARNVEDTGVGGEGAAFLPPIDTVIAATKAPSAFAVQLGTVLHEAKGIGSIVHWGNEGFCVDVAVRHPKRAEDVTIGVLCDFARFGLAPDPVEWDIFRTGMLTANGWTLKRVWSPVFFRDASGQTAGIVKAALEAAKT